MLLRGIMVAVLGYVFGSIPFGLIIVRLRRGRDIRQWYSGRTGGTNVMRVAGFWSGLATAVLDIGKATLAVYVARWLTGGLIWAEVVAGIFAVIGHNYSVFLMRKEEGRMVFFGGAGGSAAFGGAIGIWPPTLLIIFPLELLIFFGIGYASITTLSIPILAGIIFAIRASLGIASWGYVVYALGAELLILWSLRPNLQRLARGEERLVGWRARRKIARDAEAEKDTSPQANDQMASD
jgi:glycerol-3-phosphate acyltransferase PlsY